MSYVIAATEYVEAAAADLANIGSAIGDANMAASVPTSSVLAPGADEVSAVVAALFDAHSQTYQALSAQAAAFHAQFVQLMNSGAAQYAFTEAANAAPLQTAYQGVLSQAGATGQALSSLQPMLGAAAAPASAAAAVPAALTGLTGGSSSAVPAAAVSPVSAVAPASAVPASGGGAVAPVGAAPMASAALASASAGTPAAPMQPLVPGYANATGAPVAALPAADAAPVAEVPGETPEITAATTATPLPATPLSAAAQSAPAYRPATAPYSPGASEEPTAASA